MYVNYIYFSFLQPPFEPAGCERNSRHIFARVSFRYYIIFYDIHIKELIFLCWNHYYYYLYTAKLLIEKVPMQHERYRKGVWWDSSDAGLSFLFQSMKSCFTSALFFCPVLQLLLLCCTWLYPFCHKLSWRRSLSKHAGGRRVEKTTDSIPPDNTHSYTNMFGYHPLNSNTPQWSWWTLGLHVGLFVTVSAWQHTCFFCLFIQTSL